MELLFSEQDKERILHTLESIKEKVIQLIDWNAHVRSPEEFYRTTSGMQLLAADCTLITAIGEGVNRINRINPVFLQSEFPEIPWRAIVGMRNHIAHGYFELDADLVFEAISMHIPPLLETIQHVIEYCSAK